MNHGLQNWQLCAYRWDDRQRIPFDWNSDWRHCRALVVVIMTVIVFSTNKSAKIRKAQGKVQGKLEGATEKVMNRVTDEVRKLVAAMLTKRIVPQVV